MFLFFVVFLNSYVHKVLCKRSIVYALVYFNVHLDLLSNFMLAIFAGVYDAVPKLNRVMKAALEDAKEPTV